VIGGTGYPAAAEHERDAACLTPCGAFGRVFLEAAARQVDYGAHPGEEAYPGGGVNRAQVLRATGIWPEPVSTFSRKSTYCEVFLEKFDRERSRCRADTSPSQKMHAVGAFSGKLETVALLATYLMGAEDEPLIYRVPGG
jgi:hypothetical protein